MLKQLLRTGPEHLDQFDDNQWSLLHHAADAGQPACVSLLLQELNADLYLLEGPTAIELVNRRTPLSAADKRCIELLDNVRLARLPSMCHQSQCVCVCVRRRCDGMLLAPAVVRMRAATASVDCVSRGAVLVHVSIAVASRGKIPAGILSAR